MSDNSTARLLGYPPDARLLIINADDFGMCHASNAATIRAFREGIVSSTTLMAPCPWATHAMRLLRENPDLPFGVHLTIVSEMAEYRWGPLTNKSNVPSLVDECGYFFGTGQIPELIEQADLDEVRMEFRAQIETVLTARLEPTHLDWHCLRNGGSTEIFELTYELAREYGLAMRLYDPPATERVSFEGLPTNDHPVLDSYSLDPAMKSAKYGQLLRDLPVGLNEWAVHPSLGDAEAQAMEPDSWQVRKSDFDFLISKKACQIVEEESIAVIDYKRLQSVWRRRTDQRS